MRMHRMYIHKLSVHLLFTHGNVRRVVEDDVVAWRRLVARHAEVWGALERDLSERHGLVTSEFEVLERLAEAGTAESCGSRSWLPRCI